MRFDVSPIFRLKISIFIIRSLSQVKTGSLLGFILNVPAPTFKFLNFLRPCVDRRHWISFRRIEGNFYNFDSLQNSPSLIGSDEDMITYLSRELKLPDRNLILVVADHVDDSSVWKE